MVPKVLHPTNRVGGLVQTPVIFEWTTCHKNPIEITRVVSPTNTIRGMNHQVVPPWCRRSLDFSPKSAWLQPWAPGAPGQMHRPLVGETQIQRWSRVQKPWFNGILDGLMGFIADLWWFNMDLWWFYMVYVPISIYLSLSIYIYIYIYMSCVLVKTYMYFCLQISIVCNYLQLYMYIRILVWARFSWFMITCIYIYVYIYIYTHVYIYRDIFLPRLPTAITKELPQKICGSSREPLRGPSTTRGDQSLAETWSTGESSQIFREGLISGETSWNTWWFIPRSSCWWVSSPQLCLSGRLAPTKIPLVNHQGELTHKNDSWDDL